MAELFKSINLFFTDVIKSGLSLLAVLLCGLPSYFFNQLNNYPGIKKKLPIFLQEYNLMISYLLLALFILSISFIAYHKLRMKMVGDGFKYIPEAVQGKVFRELYLLYREGLNCVKTTEERQQLWDKEIIIMLNDHFNDWCKFYYLQATKRRPELNNITVLEADQFNTALSYIETLVNSDFNTYFKS
jgi:hypothetical protein